MSYPTCSASCACRGRFSSPPTSHRPGRSNHQSPNAGGSRDARSGVRRALSHPCRRTVRGGVPGASASPRWRAATSWSFRAATSTRWAATVRERRFRSSSIFTPGEHDDPPQLSDGGGGTTSRFVCGYLNCDQRFSPLVEALPTMLLVRSRDDYPAIEVLDTLLVVRPLCHRDRAPAGDDAEVHDQRSQGCAPRQCGDARATHGADVR